MLVNHVYNVDCLSGLLQLPEESVDMFLIDPPYGITENLWDKEINKTKLWRLLLRDIKPNGVVAMFGKGLFSAEMIMACKKYYRYTLIWEKTQPVDFLNANRKPLSSHEDILIFYQKLPTYNPQKTYDHPRKVATAEHKRNTNHSTNYGEYKNTSYDSTERYPTTVLRFANDKQRLNLHPTQKPLDLCRWLIRSYTNKGDLVVDCCCGSGTTLVAASLEGRNFIGMDNGYKDNTNISWCEVAKKRLKELTEKGEEVANSE